MQANKQPNFEIPSPQALPTETLISELKSSETNGLTAKQARARLARCGKNLFRREIELSLAGSFKNQLRGLTNLFFLLSMLVLYLFGQDPVYLLAIGVSAVLMLFGAGAELLAARIMKTQEKYSALAVRVIRDGKEQKIDSRALVPGDLLFLTKGNLVPADARILAEEGELTALETPVSGVRRSAVKNGRFPAGEDEAVSQNMLYAGTILTGGSCTAMVCRTGKHTLFNQIHAKKEPYLPPLLRRVQEFCRYVSIACILGCFLLVIAGTVRGTDINTLFALSAAVGAASLCDSALSLAHVSFADGLRRLAEDKLVVRNLDRVARLASANTVMCKKELTFPPKKVRLHCVYAGGRLYGADSPPPHAAQELLKLSLVCSDHPRSRRPFEQVTYTYLNDCCVGVSDITETWFRIDTAYGGEGEVNAVISLHDDHNRTVIKGAPETVLSRCAGYEQDGKEYKLTPASRRKILAAAENAAKSNAYLVAIASGKTVADSLRSPFAERQLIFRGFLAFRLSMEVDIAGGMYRAARAGIEAVVSTNDPYYTAASIGKSAGIIEHEGQMISSREIKATERGMFVLNAGKYKLFLEPDDDEWLDVLLLRKQSGRTVLATATEESEIPLLREADVSAVPVQVSDAMRESADLTMLESGFHVLADGITNARMLFLRLRWLVQYLTAGVCSLFLTVLLAVLFGGYPFRIQELLFGGMIANLAIASVIALLPTDRKLLNQHIPRQRKHRTLRELLTEFLPPLVYAAGNGAALYALFRFTGSTVCVMLGFVLSQFFYACGCLWQEGALAKKKFGYRALWLLFPCLAVYFLLLLALPGLNTALGFALPSIQQAAVTLLCVSVWQAAVQPFLSFFPKIKK